METEETPRKQKILQSVGWGIFLLVFVSLSVSTLLLADFVGTGYSPRWEDGFGLLLNGGCCSVCIILIIVSIGSVALIRAHWIHLIVVILLLMIAAVQAHPYLSAWEALRNAELDMDLAVPGPPRTEAPSIWPYPPEHDWRTTSERDFDGDRQKELLVVDHYTGLGSSREINVNVGIYEVHHDTYTLVFFQSVDEQRYYNFYEECPDKSSYLGSHSAIQFLNLDADRQVEIFAHQAMDTIPPHCRFNHYYDWVNGVAQSFRPNPFWLAERGLYFFGLPIIVLAMGIAQKKLFHIISLVASFLYFTWSLFEAWLSSDFRVWAIMSGIAIATTILRSIMEKRLCFGGNKAR